jgi:hypothetical protein
MVKEVAGELYLRSKGNREFAPVRDQDIKSSRNARQCSLAAKGNARCPGERTVSEEWWE